MLRAFLISGTPLHRLQYFKPLFERDGVSTVHESHMAAYIPRVEHREFETIKTEIRGQYLSIAFDGTSRLGEAINITGRYCTDRFGINLRLLRFITAKLHLKGPEFASLITRILCTELAVSPDMLVAISRDSVLVNGLACKLLMQSPFNAAENQLCIAHTLNNVGARIQFYVLSEFMTPWLELVGGRHPHRGAQALWRAAVHPATAPGFSNTRWYSLAEIQFVLARHYDKLAPFMDKLNELKYGDATRQKMNNILQNRTQSQKMRLQLACMLDLECLVRTTYELEGDRLELLLVYDRVESLRERGKQIQAGSMGVLCNLDAALRQLVQLKPGVPIQKVKVYSTVPACAPLS